MRIFASILLLLALVITPLLASGCASQQVKPAAKPVPILPHPHQDPPELKSVGVSLNFIIVLATVAVGAGLGLYFFLPVAHNLSLPIVGVAAGIQITCLITRVSLWFIPYVVLILGIGAVGFFVYELIRNHKAINDRVDTAFKAIDHTTRQATSYVDHIWSELGALERRLIDRFRPKPSSTAVISSTVSSTTSPIV